MWEKNFLTQGEGCTETKPPTPELSLRTARPNRMTVHLVAKPGSVLAVAILDPSDNSKPLTVSEARGGIF